MGVKIDERCCMLYCVQMAFFVGLMGKIKLVLKFCSFGRDRLNQAESAIMIPPFNVIFITKRTNGIVLKSLKFCIENLQFTHEIFMLFYHNCSLTQST